MSETTPRSSYKIVRSYVFDSSNDNYGVKPVGMYTTSSSSSGGRLSGSEAIGNTRDSYVVVCLDKQPTTVEKIVSIIARKSGRTALLHILKPSERNLYEGLMSAQDFDVETLAIDERTPTGLVAAHTAHIPLTGLTRSGEVMSHIADMSGDAGCIEELRPTDDLVSLDWREATPADFDRFAATVTDMKRLHSILPEPR